MTRLIRCLLLSFVVLFPVFLSSLSAAIEEPNGAKFRIGVIVPLTGPLAEYGIATQNGIEMARFEAPSDFSNIEFLYDDSQWDAKKAVSSFNRLTTSEKVSLIYNWGNPTTEALAPIAERNHTPLLALSMDSKVAVGKSFVVRSTPSGFAIAQPLTRYLKGQSYKKIGIIMAENTYVQSLYDGLVSGLSGSGAELEVIQRYAVSEHDFRASLLKLRQREYNALGIFLISGQVSDFYRQMIEQNLHFITFGADFFESTNEIRLAQGGMNGAVYPNLDVTKDFRDRYVARYKNDYQIAFAGNAHDMAFMLGKLFNARAKPFSGQQIMDTISKSGEFEGVCGRFKYQNTAQEGPFFEFPVRLKKIVGDKIETMPIL